MPTNKRWVHATSEKSLRENISSFYQYSNKTVYCEWTKPGWYYITDEYDERNEQTCVYAFHIKDSLREIKNTYIEAKQDLKCVMDNLELTLNIDEAKTCLKRAISDTKDIGTVAQIRFLTEYAQLLLDEYVVLRELHDIKDV